MDVFFSALLQVLAPHTFGIMLVGIGVGLLVGILPGLGGAATLAMMLPFVYPMDAISAFAFLLGMHAVTATTGDITSVLFGIPGEATSAATVLDGYPMTRRGEGGRALGAVLFSSLVGALVGAGGTKSREGVHHGGVRVPPGDDRTRSAEQYPALYVRAALSLGRNQRRSSCRGSLWWRRSTPTDDDEAQHRDAAGRCAALAGASGRA
jgi:hypothetical protein